MDEPTGWRCHLMKDLRGVTTDKNDPFQVDFKDRDEAIEYKKMK